MQNCREINTLKRYIGESLYTKLKKYNAMVAGGTITSIFTRKEIHDIDLYFKNKEDAANFLKDVGHNRWIIAKTEKAILFRYKELEIQVIFFRYFEKVEDIFKTFDYTINMGGYDFANEQLILHDDFLKDNARRELIFNYNTAYPIISALRVQKYTDRGYHISRTEFIKIMMIVANLEVNTLEELKEQTGGMYGESYDELLPDIDNKNFDLCEIVQKITEVQDEQIVLKKHEAFESEDGWYDMVNKALGIEICKNFEDPWGDSEED